VAHLGQTQIDKNSSQQLAFLVIFRVEHWVSAAEISSFIHDGVHLYFNLSFIYKARPAMNNLSILQKRLYKI
jgi:hypothetical protein